MLEIIFCLIFVLFYFIYLGRQWYLNRTLTSSSLDYSSSFHSVPFRTRPRFFSYSCLSDTSSSLRSRFLSSSSYTSEDKYSRSRYNSTGHDYGVNSISHQHFSPTRLDLASMRSSFKPSSSSTVDSNTSSRYTPRNLTSRFGTSCGIAPDSKLAKSSNVGSSEESLSRTSGRISSQTQRKSSTLHDSSSDKSDSDLRSQRKIEGRTYLKYGQPPKKEHHSSSEDLSVESGVPVFLRRSHRMRKYGSETSPIETKKCSSETLSSSSRETLLNTVPKADVTSSVLERRTSDSSQFSDNANRFARANRKSLGDTGLSQDAPRKHRRSRYHTSDTPTDSDRKDPNSDYKVPILKPSSRLVESTQVLSSSDLSSSSDTETYPSKRGVFRRPEIPSVLRRSTPPERSQSFKDDGKPPVPENSVQKSASFRSTLKRPEGGTAFLLSRRQKSDDDLISATAVFKLPSKSCKDEHFIEDDEGIDVSKSNSKLSIDSNESLNTEESKELELFLPEPIKSSEYTAVPKTKPLTHRETYLNKTGLKQETIIPTCKLPTGKVNVSDVVRKHSDVVYRNNTPFSTEPVRKTSDSIVRPTYLENVLKNVPLVSKPSSITSSELSTKSPYSVTIPSQAHSAVEKPHFSVSSGEQTKKLNFPTERRVFDDKGTKLHSYTAATKSTEDKSFEDTSEKHRKSSDTTVVPPFLLKGRKLAESEPMPTNLLYSLKKSTDKDGHLIDGSSCFLHSSATKVVDDESRFGKPIASSKLETYKTVGGLVSFKNETEPPKSSESIAVEKRISLTSFHDNKPEHREVRTVIPLKQVPITEVKIAEPKVATVSTIKKESSPIDNRLPSQPISYQEMVNKVAQSRQQALKNIPQVSSPQRLSREIIPTESVTVQSSTVNVHRSRETSRPIEPLRLPKHEVAVTKLEASRPSATDTAVVTIAKVIDSAKSPVVEAIIEPPSGIRIHRKEAEQSSITLSEPQKVFTAIKSETLAKKEMSLKVEESQDKREKPPGYKVQNVSVSNTLSIKELSPVKVITPEKESADLERKKALISAKQKDTHILTIKTVKAESEPEVHKYTIQNLKENAVVITKVQEEPSTIKVQNVLSVKEPSPVKITKADMEPVKSKEPTKPTSPNLPRVPFISKRKAGSDLMAGEVARSPSVQCATKNEKEKPILKSPSTENKPITESRPSSILKRTNSDEREDATPLSILKKKSTEEIDIEPQSIMKKKSLEEVEEKQREPQGILKMKFANEEVYNQEISSILKTRDTSDDSLDRNNAQRSSILKPMVIEDPLIKPSSILKQRSFEITEGDAEQKAPLVFKTKSFDSDVSPLRSPNSETLSLQSILRKKKETSPFPIRDGPSPELALVLKSRREQDSESSGDEKFVDASTEQTENEESSILSVAERVYEMETKIEEEKFSKAFRSLPTTPFPFSGHATPQNRLGSATPPIKSRSGDSTPRLEERLANLLTKEPISDEQLLSRLVCVASDERRRRFPRRDHIGERYRTQPVTLDEIEETDSSEAVTAFRTLIMRKASFNVFEQREKESVALAKYGDKKTEYPHTFKKRKGKERSRYKTLPVTVEERSEAEKLIDANKKEKIKFSKVEMKREENRDKDKNEDDSAEDELSKMSVSAKTSLFKQLEAEQKKAAELAHQAIGARRKINKRFQLRSQTQPVTQEEVKTAAKIASEESSDSREESKVSPEIINKSKEAEDKSTASDSDEDVSRLTLAEKMKIFAQQPESKPPPKSLPPVLKKRRGCSRFKTQPVTFEEVEKATKISPLAVTLIKPPDPDVLSSMPINAARDFIVKHAEETLKPSAACSIPDSQIKSAPVEKVSEEKSVKGILKINYAVEETFKPKHTESNSGVKSILKAEKEIEHPVKEALKKDGSVEKETKEIKHIVKCEKPAFELELEKAIQDLKSSTSEGADDKTLMVTKKEAVILQQQALQKQSRDESVVNTYQATVRQLQQIQQARQQQTQAEQQVQTQQSQIVQQVSMQKQIHVQQQVHVQQIQNMQQVNIQLQKAFEQVQTQIQSNDSLESRSDDKRKTGNPAIQRRRNAAMRRMEESDDSFHRRSMHVESVTQVMPEKSPESATDKRRIRPFGQRSMTAPLTTEEVQEAEEVTEVHGASIAERLAALQKRGQEDWKKRVSRIKDPDYEYLERETREISPLKNRDRSVSESSARSFINETLTQLEGAQETWRSRIEEKDATQFTVAGKMGKKSPKVIVEISPLSCRKKRTPKPIAFRSKTAGLIDLNTPSSPTTCDVPSPTSPVCPVSTSTPTGRPGRPLLQKSLTLGFVGEGELQLRTDDSVAPARVEIPRVHDEAFESFFQSISPEKLKLLKIDIDEAAFDKVTQSSELLVQKRTVRTQRKHVASKNPLKTLAQRTDLQSTYVEVKTDIAEKELRRIKKEQVAKDATFAQSALAGLASREDFSRISLRKTPVNMNAPMLPYQDLMLLQVKGRRHAQVRLVEPCVKSLNSGDCFILITPNEVFHWIGKFCNVIEKSKGAEVAGVIQAKKDLGCKLANEVITIEEEKVQPKATKKLLQLLGANEQENIRDAGNPNEDELYEACIIETNMIYKVDKDQLVPYKEYWGCLPKIEMLESKQVLVFDFGSEMYIWLGKQAPFEIRKIGIQLAKELWEDGYDYSDCDINPLNPLVDDSLPNKVGSKRPNWALFGKQNEFMETVLFREKFLDWPDPDRIIKVKGPDSEVKQGDVSLELTPYDARLMLIVNTEEPSLVLEGQNVGRGDEWIDEMERRHYDINTLKVTVWHILEYDHTKLPLESVGQFHSGDTYVVRWQYMITNIGARALSGAASRWSFVGRERCAYFFWQGRHSTINEKGASALMTVELDEERGPHVRVVEGKEPPCFSNLFEGGLVIHIGKREEEETNTRGTWKMYIARNELENEGCLVEIPCKMTSLRSRTSFVCLNIKQGVILIWHGSKAHLNIKKVALRAAEKIKEVRPPEIGFDEKIEINIYEIDEGSETEEFCRALGSHDCSLYMSLVNDSRLYNFMPRLFAMSSVSGQFEAQEILCPSRTNKAVCSFPFLQSDLYKISQPALFLIDNHYEIFLWQGWWPEGDESENVVTGSAKVRWDIDRRCAMETAIQYCKEKDSKNSMMLYLVSAGLEPQSFTNLFPFWEHYPDIAELNMRDGRRPGEMPLVNEVLAKLSRKQYTLAELHEQPEGVDPSRLESYLSEAEFHEVLGMSKEEFYSLPAWKQTNLKKAGNLF